MLVQINNFPEMIESYIKTAIKSKYPNTDISDNSPVVDLIAFPIAAIANEFIQYATDIEARNNLSNAAVMAEVDLDEIGWGNYMIERKAGEKTTGTVTFKFQTISDTQSTTIPSGMVISTRSGLKFIVTTTQSYTPQEMYENWNSADLSYDVDVIVEAENVGAAYNVSPGEITIIDTAFTSHPVTVVNNIAFSGGSDKESNTKYAARILKFLSSRTLETASGYDQDIKENFPEVKDVYVAGYEDPLMMRDLVESITINGVTFTDRHIGGKTDIYVRGATISTDTLTLTGRTNRLPLPEESEKVDTASIVVTNSRTSMEMNGITTEINSNDKVVVIVPPTDDQWILGDTLNVAYDIDEDEDDIFETPKMASFEINTVIDDLICPLVSVLSIENKTRANVFYDIGDGRESAGVYTITFEDLDFESTSREAATFELTEDSIDNGDEISVIYSYNKTLTDLADHYDLRENRVVTRDLLFLEAHTAYMFIGISVKLVDGITQSSSIESAITNVVANFFDDMARGSRVDESDIVHALYSNEATSSFIDYVRLPMTTFYSTDDQNDIYESGRRDGTKIHIGSIEYPVLHTIEIAYVDGSEVEGD